MGGAWAVGCSICASALRRRKRAGTDHRQYERQSKWAKCEIIDAPRNRLEAHSNALGHRRAVKIAAARCPTDAEACRPAAEPSPRAAEPAAVVDAPAAAGIEETAVGVKTSALDAAAEEELKLLSGRVPQCQDWLDAWVDCGQSFRKQRTSAEKHA